MGKKSNNFQGFQKEPIFRIPHSRHTCQNSYSVSVSLHKRYLNKHFGLIYLILILLCCSTEAFFNCRASVNCNKECLCHFITATIKTPLSSIVARIMFKKVYNIEINAASCFLLLGDIFPLNFLFSIFPWLLIMIYSKSHFKKILYIKCYFVPP